MPHITSPRQNMRIILADIQLGQTTFKQVGYVIEQNWKQPRATGEVEGEIVVQLVRHAADATQPDGLGVELAEFNPVRPVRLRGANDTLLAADTGEELARQGTLLLADWQALVQTKAAELAPRPVILQGDALELLRENAVVVAAEIRRHLEAAPAARFAPLDAAGQPLLGLGV